ncbi:unnamed protein product [Adineta ricciae]|uniref:Serine/threonine-protein kinase cst-1 n=1 Tax=Adineta ricciae TaxID=249248 RepID=A0A814JYM8_ADIRI|nr:unnamed protein product [Adineta ricciae]
MDRRILCDSLIKWMKTLNLNRTINGAVDLSDGVSIGLCLKNIDGNHFNENWLQKIRIDAGDNYRIKANNLKKVLKNITDYYSEVLGQSLVDFQMPDLNMIAESTDETELSRLLQLVLGCAVSCDRKQIYIEHIMSMEESVQHVLMNAIQELMVKENRKNNEEYSELGEQLKHALEELNRVVEAKEEIENRCRELDLQISTLQDEKLGLIQETAQLHERIQQFENADDSDSVAKSRYKTLQQRIESQQEEIFKLETAVQDYKAKFDDLREENESLLKRNDDLMVLASDARNFKDELDILRNKCEKLTKLEATIDTYKVKLEEMADLRQQIKYLEETNLRLFDEKSNIEQEYKQAKLLQTQVEFHKRTNQELYQKISELQRLADKAEFERNRTEEKLNVITAEKSNLMNEIELLKETNEQLQAVNLNEVTEGINSKDQLTGSLEDLNFFNLPVDVRERFIRLQHENKMLKLRQTEENNNEQLLLIQANCDHLKDQNNQLTNDLWMANQKILELEATLKDTTSLAANTSEITDLKKSLNRAMARHDEESGRSKMLIDDLQRRLDASEKQLVEKEKMIATKTTEISAMEERYVQYLEKAKMILRQMDPRNTNSIGNQELQLLRKQIDEKDRRLKELDKEYEKMKAIKEDQEKLLISAWYSLGSTFQRREFEERLKSHENQSFLSKQRNIPSARKQLPSDPSTNQIRYQRCYLMVAQRCLSTPPSASTKAKQISALPVGTGLSTVESPNNLPIMYVPSLMTRIKMKLGLQGDLREPQKVLYQAAAISYYMIASSVDYDAIQRELNMPDVFASFGRVVFLHIWLILVRYIQLGPSGVYLRRHLARTMWTDLDMRAQQILPGQAKVRRSQFDELRAEMNAFMLALDEGLVDDDTVLAAAVWRHLCSSQPTSLDRLANIVTYIRKNVRHLEQLPDENFLKNGYIYFLPMHSDTVDTKFVNQHYLDFKNKAGGLMANTFDRLTEEALAQNMENVLEIVCKIGKGSYGCVYKAKHRETGHLLAIKQVPVESDLQEIVKEISIMKQCDSPYIVKYFGSYFKESDLWIVMEYCGAGSVSDILKLRGKTLNEQEIAVILKYTLKGLEYLHMCSKIHRDIKAGNILLTNDGNAKLADFGVAGQLTDTMAKRNTMIGTPFWMAPEVIQEIGHGVLADIWSLGITTIEIAEGKPPYSDIHPMRAIFMIPSRPPPTFKDMSRWTPALNDFVSKCLVKNPDARSTATELIKHEFIRNAKDISILRHMIDEVREIQERHRSTLPVNSTMFPHGILTERPFGSDGTLTNANNQGGSIFPENQPPTLMNTTRHDTQNDTFQSSSCNTMIELSSESSDTMIINENGTETENDADSQQDTLKISNKPSTNYKAPFANVNHSSKRTATDKTKDDFMKIIAQEVRAYNKNEDDFKHTVEEFSVEEIEQRLALLDEIMEVELREVQNRFQSKRKPILDAIKLKKQTQTHH